MQLRGNQVWIKKGRLRAGLGKPGPEKAGPKGGEARKNRAGQASARSGQNKSADEGYCWQKDCHLLKKVPFLQRVVAASGWREASQAAWGSLEMSRRGGMATGKVTNNFLYNNI